MLYTYRMSGKVSRKTLKHSTGALDSALKRLEAQHRALLREIGSIGFVLRGTISDRLLPCGKPNCRCRADPPILHGPYTVWTRKVEGKTVTRRFSAEQALRCRQWSANRHKLDRLLQKLQAIGFKAVVAVKTFS